MSDEWKSQQKIGNQYFTRKEQLLYAKLLSNMNLKRKHKEELKGTTWGYVPQLKSLQERNYINSFCIIYIYLQYISSILLLITSNVYYKQLQQEQRTVKTWKY